MLKTTVYLTKKKLRITQFNISKESFKVLKDKSIPLSESGFDSNQLKIILQRENLAKINLTAVLFRHEVGMRFFMFPSSQDQEISKMVDYEAGELLPLKPEETITRHIVLNVRSDGYSNTLVVVTHKDEVDKLVEKFQEAGVGVGSLNLSSLAIYACVKRILLKKRKEPLKGNFLVVYCEDGVVEVSMLKKGNLIFNRGFVIADAKNFSQNIISEIRHSMTLFSDSSNVQKIERIILSGKDVNLDEIKDVLQDKFEIPIHIEDKIDIAYGLAIGGKKQINMLSDEFINQRTMGKVKKKIIFSAALLLLNIILLGGIFLVRLNNKKTYLDYLKNELIQLKPQAKKLQAKIEKIEMVKMQLNSQVVILNAISDLVRVTSSACKLNMLSVNEAGSLVIRGQSKNLQEVLDFVVALEKSPYFKNSHLNYSSRRKIKDRQILDFEIQSDLIRDKIEN